MDPNADTEWNDILRAKGILPQKEPEINEDEIAAMIEETVKNKTEGPKMEDMSLSELNEIEDDLDEEDERVFEAYRRQRLLEMKQQSQRPYFSSVKDIRGEDWVQEVNNAGEDIWVVLHLYRPGVMLCNVINNHLNDLVRRFPHTKFLKAIANTCIPNYPDHNLPTIFVYKAGKMMSKLIGEVDIGTTRMTISQLEWVLSKTGAIETELTEDPTKPIDDLSTKNIFYSRP